MKKIKLLFVMVLAVLALSVSSCKKAKAKNCDNAVTEYADAQAKFFDEYTVAACEEYKATLKTFVDDCLSKFPEATRAIIQEIYDDIDDIGCEDYVSVS